MNYAIKVLQKHYYIGYYTNSCSNVYLPTPQTKVCVRVCVKIYVYMYIECISVCV